MRQSRVSQELQQKTFELTLAVYRVTDFFPQGEALKRQLREKANDIFGAITEYGHALDGEQEGISLLTKLQVMQGYLEIARSMRFIRPVNLAVLDREYAFLAHFFEKELEMIRRRHEMSQETNHAVVSRDAMPVPNSGNGTVSRLSHKTIAVQKSAARRTDRGGQRPVHVNIRENKSRRGLYPAYKIRQEKADSLRTLTDTKQTNHGKDKHALSGINNRQEKILAYVRQSSPVKISDFYSFFSDTSSKTIQRDLRDLVEKNVLIKDGDRRWTVYSLNRVT
ncbi:MAG: DeoR family transcriptional regulator [Candidatus Sungbacteria bacterium]|nr:DeoR family transcriptional regulator [Candidatus Sungbacteria bacterium]